MQHKKWNSELDSQIACVNTPCSQLYYKKMPGILVEAVLTLAPCGDEQ